MKKTTLMTITTAMAVVFGLNACTDAQMADMEHAMKDSQKMQNMQRDCKTYVSGKVGLPMAAVSVSPGHESRGHYILPVSIKWTDPTVDETGQCKVVDGKAVSYKASYE